MTMGLEWPEAVSLGVALFGLGAVAGGWLVRWRDVGPLRKELAERTALLRDATAVLSGLAAALRGALVGVGERWQLVGVLHHYDAWCEKRKTW